MNHVRDRLQGGAVGLQTEERDEEERISMACVVRCGLETGGRVGTLRERASGQPVRMAPACLLFLCRLKPTARRRIAWLMASKAKY